MADELSHPIVDHTLIRLVQKPDKTWEFKPGGIDEVRQLLGSLGDDWVQAAQDMVAFAYYLEKEMNSPQPAADILLVLEVFKSRLATLRDSAHDGATAALERASGKFARFSGPQPKQVESDKEKVPAHKLSKDVKG